MAEVAKTFPCEPAASTDTEAKRTMISAEQECTLIIRLTPKDDYHPLRSRLIGKSIIKMKIIMIKHYENYLIKPIILSSSLSALYEE